MMKYNFDDFDALMIALPEGDDVKVWKHFISIQTDLSFDDSITSSEKNALEHLNNKLSAAIAQRSSYIISQQIRNLRSSLEDRTNGS